MLRLQQGDQTAFDELVMHYQRTVLNYAYRYLGDNQKAQDIAQETFIRIFKAYKRWRPQANFRTWLLTITTRLCLNEIRSRKRERKALSPVTDTADINLMGNLPDNDARSPMDTTLAEERKRILHRAMDTLPENQKRALLLHKFEGLSYQETADIMEVSLEAVRSLLVRARKNLHRTLLPVLGRDIRPRKS